METFIYVTSNSEVKLGHDVAVLDFMIEDLHKEIGKMFVRFKDKPTAEIIESVMRFSMIADLWSRREVIYA